MKQDKEFQNVKYRFHQEIRKKKTISKINKTRQQFGYVGPDLMKYVSKLNQYLDQNNQYGLEYTTKQFLGISNFSLEELLKKGAEEQVFQKFGIILNLVNYGYQQNNELIKFWNKDFISKCFNINENLSKAAYNIIKNCCGNDSIVQYIFKQKLYKKLNPNLPNIIDIHENVFLILENLTNYIIESIADFQQFEEEIKEFLSILFVWFDYTKNYDIITLITLILQKDQDELIMTYCIEQRLQNLRHIEQILKTKQNLKQKNIAAELLQIFFYGNDNIICTLILSGFYEYVDIMLSTQLLEIGLFCLEGIFLTKEQNLVKIVQQKNYADFAINLCSKFIYQHDILNYKIDLALMRCIINLIEYQQWYQLTRFDWQKFISNCKSRLQNQSLAYQTLSILLYAPEDFWRKFEQYQILSQIEQLSKCEQIKNKAQQILQRYYQESNMP